MSSEDDRDRDEVGGGAAEATPVQDRPTGLLASASVISAATMSSRILGLLREHIFARLFGASGDFFADAFNTAYRIPNLFRDLLAEGALSSAFVPTFTDQRENHGEAAAFHLAQIVFTALTAIVGGLTVVGILFAPGVVDLVTPEMPEEKRALTITLTRITMPFILLASWAAVCRGILNTYHQYFLPALAPCLFNVVAVVTGLGLWWAGIPPEEAIYGWAAATIVGGAVTCFVQLPPLFRLGFRIRPALGLAHAGFRRILRLMGPATLGLAAVQVNVVVNSFLALKLGTGPMSWLNYSFRLVYLPIGVVGVAIATVSTVHLSRRVARGDLDGFRADVIRSLRLVAFMTLPATVGLIVLAVPVSRLVYEYGKFTSADTIACAAATIAYAWGLFFYSAVKILAPAFYALNLIRVPLIASTLAVITNLVWSVSTYESLGYTALAHGTALAATVNFLALAWTLRRHVSLELDSPLRPVPRSLGLALRMAVLLVPMAFLTAGLHRGIEGALGTESVLARAVAVLVPVGMGMALVIVGGRWLRLPEATEIWEGLRRRTRRQ